MRKFLFALSVLILGLGAMGADGCGRSASNEEAMEPPAEEMMVSDEDQHLDVDAMHEGHDEMSEESMDEMAEEPELDVEEEQ